LFWASQPKQAGKHDWAVFLSTDVNLEAAKVLEIYALRWAVEVYFKEAKQHLGFLKEQSIHYAAYIASIHLVAIRFCMLISAKHNSVAAGFKKAIYVLLNGFYHQSDRIAEQFFQFI
jgi:IS4 transposase